MTQSTLKHAVCAGVVAAVSLMAVDLEAGGPSDRNRGKSQERGRPQADARPAPRRVPTPPSVVQRSQPTRRDHGQAQAPRLAPAPPLVVRRPSPPVSSSDDKHKHFGLGISDHGLSLRFGESSRDKGFSIGLNLGGHAQAAPVRSACGHSQCRGLSVCGVVRVYRPAPVFVKPQPYCPPLRPVVHVRHDCGHGSCFGLSYCRIARPAPVTSCSIRYYPGSTTRYCAFHHSGYHADCHLHFASPVIVRTVVVSEPEPVFEVHTGIWMLLIDQPHEAALAFSKHLDRREDDAMARLGHAVAQARIGDDAVAIWSSRDAMRRDATVLGRVPDSAELQMLFLKLAERFRHEARAGDRPADRWFMISALYAMRGEWSAAEVALENARYHGDSSPSERSLGLFIDGRFETATR